MGTAGWIILILAAVWWIVQSIAQAAAKKKEEQRLEELARRRREQAQTGASAAAPRESRSAPAPAQSSFGERQMVDARRQSQIEDLRRRRQHQLDELRRRKQQRATTQARTGATASSPPSVRQAPAPVQPLSRPAPQPVARPRQPVRATIPVARAAADRPDKGRTMVPRAAPVEIEEPASPEQPIGKESEGPTLHRHDRESRAGVYRQLLTGRTSLRQAFVMKEILDDPIALRESDLATTPI